MPVLPITLFADFTSAASYVTEAAVWRRAGAGGVAVDCRAFEAGPGAAPETEADWESGIRALAEALELPLHPPRARPPTGKAHEAARYAREHGREEALRRAVHLAYWGAGADIGRIDVLQELAAGVGLDPFEVKVALDIDRHRDEVLRDQALARRLGIRRAPVLYLGTGPGALILTGAQSTAGLDAAVEAAAP